jgi:hypothetical protein
LLACNCLPLYTYLSAKTAAIYLWPYKHSAI